MSYQPPPQEDHYDDQQPQYDQHHATGVDQSQLQAWQHPQVYTSTTPTNRRPPSSTTLTHTSSSRSPSRHHPSTSLPSPSAAVLNTFYARHPQTLSNTAGIFPFPHPTTAPLSPKYQPTYSYTPNVGASSPYSSHFTPSPSGHMISPSHHPPTTRRTQSVTPSYSGGVDQRGELRRSSSRPREASPSPSTNTSLNMSSPASLSSATLAHQQQHIASLEAQLSSLQKTLQSNLRNFDIELNKGQQYAAEMLNAKLKVQQAEGRADHLQQVIQTLTVEKELHESQIGQLKQQVVQLKEEAVHPLKQAEEMNIQLKLLQEELDQTKALRKRDQANYEEQLKQQPNPRVSRHTDSIDVSGRLEPELKGAQQKIQDLSAQLKALEQLRIAEQNEHEVEVNRLQDQLQSLESSRVSSRHANQVEVFESLKLSHKQALEQRDEQHAATLAQLQTQHSEALKGAHQAAQSAQQLLHQEQEAHASTQKRLHQTSFQANTAVETAQREKATLQIEFDDYKRTIASELHASQLKIDSLEHEVAEAKILREAMEKRLEFANSQIQELTIQIQMMKKDVAAASVSPSSAASSASASSDPLVSPTSPIRQSLKRMSSGTGSSFGLASSSGGGKPEFERARSPSAPHLTAKLEEILETSEKLRREASAKEEQLQRVIKLNAELNIELERREQSFAEHVNKLKQDFEAKEAAHATQLKALATVERRAAAAPGSPPLSPRTPKTTPANFAFPSAATSTAAPSSSSSASATPSAAVSAQQAANTAEVMKLRQQLLQLQIQLSESEERYAILLASAPPLPPESSSSGGGSHQRSHSSEHTSTDGGSTSNEELITKMSKITNQLLSATKLIHTQEASIQNLTAQIQKSEELAKSQEEHHQEQIKTLNESYENQIIQLVSAHEHQIAEIEKSLKDQIEALQQEKNSLAGTNDKLNQPQVEQVEKSPSSHVEELTKLQSQIRALEQELIVERASVSTAAAAQQTLNAKVQYQQTTIQTLEANVQLQSQQLSDLRQDLLARDTTIGNLQAELETRSLSWEQSQAELGAQDQTIHQLWHDVSLKDSQMSEMKKEMSVKDLAVAEWKTKITEMEEELKTKVETYEKNLAEIHAQHLHTITEYEEKLAAAQPAFNEMKAAYEQQIATMTEEHATAFNDLKTNEETRFTTLNDQHLAIVLEYANFKTEVESTLEEVHGQMTQLQNEHDAKAQEVQELLAQRTELGQEVEKTILKLEEDQHQLETALQQREFELEELKAAHQTQSEQLAHVTHEFDETTKIIANLQHELKAIEGVTTNDNDAHTAKTVSQEDVTASKSIAPEDVPASSSAPQPSSAAAPPASALTTIQSTSDTLRARYQALQDEIEKLNTSLKQSLEKEQETSAELTQTQTELVYLHTQNTEFTSRIQELEQEVNQLTAQQDADGVRFRQLQAQLESTQLLHQEQIASLKSTHQSHLQQLTGVANIQAQKQTELQESLLRTQEQHAQDLAALRARHEEEYTAIRERHKEDLAVGVQHHSKLLAENDAQLKGLQAENEKLTQKLQSSEVVLTQAKKDVTDMYQKMLEATSALKNSQAQLAALTTVEADLRQEHEKILHEHGVMEAKLAVTVNNKYLASTTMSPSEKQEVQEKLQQHLTCQPRFEALKKDYERLSQEQHTLEQSYTTLHGAYEKRCEELRQLQLEHYSSKEYDILQSKLQYETFHPPVFPLSQSNIVSTPKTRTELQDALANGHTILSPHREAPPLPPASGRASANSSVPSTPTSNQSRLSFAHAFDTASSSQHQRTSSTSSISSLTSPIHTTVRPISPDSVALNESLHPPVEIDSEDHHDLFDENAAIDHLDAQSHLMFEQSEAIPSAISNNSSPIKQAPTTETTPQSQALPTESTPHPTAQLQEQELQPPQTNLAMEPHHSTAVQEVTPAVQSTPIVSVTSAHSEPSVPKDTTTALQHPHTSTVEPEASLSHPSTITVTDASFPSIPIEEEDVPMMGGGDEDVHHANHVDHHSSDHLAPPGIPIEDHSNEVSTSFNFFPHHEQSDMESGYNSPINDSEVNDDAFDAHHVIMVQDEHALNHTSDTHQITIEKDSSLPTTSASSASSPSAPTHPPMNGHHAISLLHPPVIGGLPYPDVNLLHPRDRATLAEYDFSSPPNSSRTHELDREVSALLKENEINPLTPRKEAGDEHHHSNTTHSNDHQLTHDEFDSLVDEMKRTQAIQASI